MHAAHPERLPHITALERLIRHAQGDTAQSRRCADFLLAWWNAGQCGGFDLTALWALDDAITADMLLVFHWLCGARAYPDSLGYGPQFERIIQQWRPELLPPC